MCAWQIISGAGDTFRWETADPEPDAEPIEPPTTRRLPSMADLLFQGCSKLPEGNECGFEKAPMFKTGLGRSVPVKQSSIEKAMSVLGGDCAIDSVKLGDETGQACMKTPVNQSSIPRAFKGDIDAEYSGQVKARAMKCGNPNSFFQTGSGKTVKFSSDGLARAKALLGLHEDNDSEDLNGFQSSGGLHFAWQNANHVGTASAPRSSSMFSAKSTDLGHSIFEDEAMPREIESRMPNPAGKPPPVKFQTAGGRSISVSSDALNRAKSLLNDSEIGSLLDVDDTGNIDFSFSVKAKDMIDTPSNRENGSLESKNFVSPLRSSSKSKQMNEPLDLQRQHSGTNLIGKFDAVSQDGFGRINGKQGSNNGFSANNTFASKKSSVNGIGLRNHQLAKPLGRQLADISNTIETASRKNSQSGGEKRKIPGAFVSPFKKPRNSKFFTPMKNSVPLAPNGFSTLSSDHSCPRGRVSMRYPFQRTRMSIKEYFGGPPSGNKMVESISRQFEWIRSDNTEHCKFVDDNGVRSIGVEAFFHMLINSGASEQYASKEWVKNHFKRIVWKLACYERYYPAKTAGKFLTISNVLEELKYRYEREVNHGHRSAIKRILEGDASPSSMMILCISAIRSNNDPKTEESPSPVGDPENHSATVARVELTDGWYSVDALLDVLLLKQLASGKLFVGQKLRIWGASLCGWAGPVPPIEVAKTVNLVLHINGTYRAHWADRLGFCKGLGIPLAFKCIKSNGGSVPMTLVGITRVYPVLFKDRLSDGRSVVRSERMENEVMQSYSQRRSIIIESIAADFQRGVDYSDNYNDSDSEEGAKLLKLLEKASEPEFLLAGMSPDQISSFTKYQAKLEAIRQSDMEKSIASALENAGLDKREVSPFMRVRVVGLTSKENEEKANSLVGLITIWNPTEKQKSKLAEGKAYNISGLLPTNTGINTDAIYLQARESTVWKPLSPQAMEHFKPFFTPRKSALLSKLGEVPLSSEFDIAAFVVFVGEVYKAAHQRKQWVFVTDSSISKRCTEDFSDCLLAICFCSPHIDDDSSVPFNLNLVGSTIGFCNLIKRAKDQMNRLWVAEASENSTYFSTFDSSRSHLKDAALSAERWAKYSHSTIDKLREKVLFVIGDCKG